MTVVGAGVTLYEALKAYDELKKEGINIRVIDPFTLKPIDKELLVASAKATGGRVITVEDHYPEGQIKISATLNGYQFSSIYSCICYFMTVVATDGLIANL